MKYHGHIYFSDNNKESILKIYQDLLKLKLSTLKVLPLVEKPVGPHPEPMIEINFEHDDLAFLKSWLYYRRGKHNVLLHENTDLDRKDHSEGALWLGEKLTINFDYFKT